MSFRSALLTTSAGIGLVVAASQAYAITVEGTSSGSFSNISSCATVGEPLSICYIDGPGNNRLNWGANASALASATSYSGSSGSGSSYSGSSSGSSSYGGSSGGGSYGGGSSGGSSYSGGSSGGGSYGGGGSGGSSYGGGGSGGGSYSGGSSGGGSYGGSSGGGSYGGGSGGSSYGGGSSGGGSYGGGSGGGTTTPTNPSTLTAQSFNIGPFDVPPTANDVVIAQLIGTTLRPSTS